MEKADTLCPGFPKATPLQQLQQPLNSLSGEVLILVAFKLLLQKLLGDGILRQHEATLPVQVFLENSR